MGPAKANRKTVSKKSKTATKPKSVKSQGTTKALIEESNLLLTLINNLPDRIYAKDIQGRRMISNTADWQASGGKRMEDVIGKTDLDIYPAELAAQYWADDKMVLDSGKPVINREEPSRDAQGHPIWRLTTKMPLRDDNGQIVGLVGIGHDITERKRIEETLAQERNLLHALIDTLPDHIYAKDAEGRFTLANISVARHMRATKPDELIGKTDFDFYPPDLATQFHADEQALIQSGVSLLDHEEFTRDPDDQRKWVLTTKVLLHDPQGNYTGLVGIGRDITERKQVEEALVKEQHDMQTIMDYLPVKIYFKDLESRFTRISKTQTQIFGLSDPAGAIGKTDFDFFTAEHAQQAYEDEQTIIRTGHPLIKEEKETWAERPDTWVSTIKMPMRDDEGNIIGIFGLSTDITERKQAEEALAQERNLLRSLIDNVPDFIYVKDIQSRFLIANSALARMIGAATPDELLGKTDFDFFPQELAAKYYADEQAIFQSGQPVLELEEPWVGAAGNQIWLSSTKILLRDAQDKIFGLVGMSRDITERKRAEAALRESEERYAVAVRGANDGIWDWNLKTNELYYSPRWKSMLGYRESEIGTNSDEWFKRIYPDDLIRLKAELDAHLKGDTPLFQSEYRMLHKNGQYLWMLSRGLAVRDAEGNAYRMAGSQTDITLQKQAEERLAHDAMHDALTGLPNRILFLDRLEHVIRRVKRSQDSLFAVMFLDIDRFKLVNDSLGHTNGDKLLASVADRLQRCLRPGDTVARMGGDEFAILLDDISAAADTTRVADRIQKELAQPYILDGQPVSISASMGITLSSANYEKADDMLRDADTAMYRAKTMGKAQHQIFDVGMHAAVSSLLELEADLRRAIQNEEFQVHYQPLISLANGAVMGTEALLRWQHPKRGLLPPSAFITILEETGMIIPVGEWVLRTACKQNKAWQDAGFPHLRVAVNFSARQFQIRNLAELIRSVLAETGMPAETLEVEITESTALKDTILTLETLDQLHALGVNISLDDFGTGYSALGYLNRYPFQTLKADRTFISDIPGDSKDTAITAAIIAMAHSLKLRVVAEGVETVEQLDFLRSNNCDEVQGFLFSRPVPPDELANLLQKKELLPKPDDATDTPNVQPAS